MRRDSLLFELCELIVSKINEASTDEANFGAFRVSAELDPAATLVLEEARDDVRVLVVPSGKTAGPQTLDGLQERGFTVNIVVSAKAADLTEETVKQLENLTESISAVIAEDVPPEMDGLEWNGEDGDTAYDHEKLRGALWYQAEMVHSWTLNGAE